MSRCEATLNPLQRDGSDRRRRALAALDPATAKIDGRGVAELLLYPLWLLPLLRPLCCPLQ